MKPAIDSVLGASVIAAALLVRWTHITRVLIFCLMIICFIPNCSTGIHELCIMLRCMSNT